MPSSDPGENNTSRKAMMGSLLTNHPPVKPGEPLPCPRCDSTHTKFCYYNNYNLSQPRYFCKGCRRYWTHGGALRNVPIGGGSRKNSKRSSRSSSSASPAVVASTTTSSISSSSTITSASALVNDNQSESVPPHVSANLEGLIVSKTNDVSGDFNLDGNVLHVKENGNFLFLNSQDHGLMGMGAYGTGFGCCPVGLGLGVGGLWPYMGVADDSGGGNTGALDGGSSGYNAWQLGDVEEGTGGLVDADYITWPSLAISAPGNALK